MITAATASLVLEPVFPLGWNDWRVWLLLLLGIIGASQMAVALVNLLANLLVGPRLLPRLDFSKGIPATDRTMVVIPTLLTSPQAVTDLVEGLEIRYLGNRDPNLFFALLTDFRDAPEPTQPDDAELLRLVREGVESLNARYSSEGVTVFHLFHRPRVWNPHERLWMGYERKRGKLEQFNALLRGGPREPFSEIIGDLAILPTIQYVLTLDTDTGLPRDAARKLIGTMAHPLNRPRFDPPTGRVVEGYAILQPRTPISLLSANRSRFAQLSAGEAGIDPYTREVSDVYQDLFAEGSYVGKGIYDVDAFRQATAGRFPENLILSHDLVESGYARSALVTDVELHEDHPANFAVEMSRRHRWIRGDWQIAGWLLPRVLGPAKKRLPQYADRARLVENLRQPAPQPRAARAAAAAARWLARGPGTDRLLDAVRAAVAPVAGAVGDAGGSRSQTPGTDVGRSSGYRREIHRPAVGGSRSHAVHVAVSRRHQSGCDPRFRRAHAVHPARAAALAHAAVMRSATAAPRWPISFRRCGSRRCSPWPVSRGSR